jgi:hypothetical protein
VPKVHGHGSCFRVCFVLAVEHVGEVRFSLYFLY